MGDSRGAEGTEINRRCLTRHTCQTSIDHSACAAQVSEEVDVIGVDFHGAMVATAPGKNSSEDAAL